ncbi:MAG TPA: gluconate 2-dehydrogenase subunit 3 family protein [Candidatus Limnocylindrales bacterium]|nr:gluconate 2-dehydrogenase subunit 3 family protein [Candidatus Limnocylindrales bacterium]
MNSFNSARRDFLQLLGGTASATWLTANWPALVSAAEHAHQAAKAGNPSLEVFTADQAREVEALTACIIPSDQTPGAREAGVVYFIDRALKTFFSEALPVYKKGLEATQKTTAELFSGLPRFSAASEEQKLKIFAHLESESERAASGSRRLAPGASPDFFQTLRVHTIFGFLIDPEGGGNRDYAGWKAIDRDPSHSFSAPFGFYDKNYPGWQPVSGETEKK